VGELDLRADCARCVGLCCVAFPFQVGADFPRAKPADQPCLNLTTEHRCAVHDRLGELGWRGCLAFDCLGAGPHVTSRYAVPPGPGGADMSGPAAPTTPTTTGTGAGTAAAVRNAEFRLMCEVFEMAAYLREAGERRPGGRGSALDAELTADLAAARDAVTDAAHRPIGELTSADVDRLRSLVGPILMTVATRVRASYQGRLSPVARRLSKLAPGADLAGRSLQGADLRGADLRGALLLGADLRDADLTDAVLLGADLRGARLDGAALAGALFLPRRALGHLPS